MDKQNWCMCKMLLEDFFISGRGEMAGKGEVRENQHTSELTAHLVDVWPADSMAMMFFEKWAKEPSASFCATCSIFFLYQNEE